MSKSMGLTVPDMTDARHYLSKEQKSLNTETGAACLRSPLGQKPVGQELSQSERGHIIAKRHA